MSHRDSAADEEEEDDYGCYFLRPVNEYQISDKIVEANRELFGDDYDPTEQRGGSVSEETQQSTRTDSSSSNTPLRPGRRHVSFRMELEDFEPDFITDNEDDDDDDEHTQDYSVSESEVEEETDAVNNATSAGEQNKLSMMLDSPHRKPNPVVSISDSTVAANTNKKIEAELNADAETVKKPDQVLEDRSPVSADTDDDEIDEICEVIEDFGLAETKVVLSDTISTVPLTVGEPTAVGREPRSDDQLSVSSDSCQSADSQVVRSDSVASSSSERLSTKQLKLIKPTRCSSGGNQRANSASTKPSSRHSHHHQPTGMRPARKFNNPNADGVDDSSMLKIQLNFKPCCEFKNAEARRLPRYCGYVSQYGLSKEQLDQRDACRERRHLRRERRTENRAAEESDKSRVNEEAFARWLAVKMRTTCGARATRNMYDCTPPRAANTRPGRRAATNKMS